MSARCNALQDLLRMPAIAERAIRRDLSALRRQRGQHFGDHDRPMRASRRLPGREDFSDGLGVSLRIVLFVFLVEATRVFAAIARTPSMRRGIDGHNAASRKLGVLATAPRVPVEQQRMRRARVFLILLIVLNCIVLLGQLWPEGAPPFARAVNILFLILALLYFIRALRGRAGSK